MTLEHFDILIALPAEDQARIRGALARCSSGYELPQAFLVAAANLCWQWAETCHSSRCQDWKLAAAMLLEKLELNLDLQAIRIVYECVKGARLNRVLTLLQEMRA